MKEVKPSPKRDRAATTRKRIIDAAHAEFLQKGFQGATFAAIAKSAGVAVQTVYFVFHTKPELISAVIDAAVLGEEPVAPEDSSWWQAMVAEEQPVEALRCFIRGASPLFERASGISEVLRAAALTDSDVRRTHEFHDSLQRAGFRAVIDLLMAKGSLRAGLDAETAADILLTVFGDSTYHLLRTERGWSQEQVVAWYCEALPLLLFPVE